MKKFNRIIKWCVIALIIQNILFIYIEKVYLNHDLSTKTIKVENHSKVVLKNISIPSNILNLQVSYDGRFIYYNENGSLKVADAASSKVNDITPSQNMNISYYKWLPEDDILLLVEKTKDSARSQYLSFYSYDAKKNTKRELTDVDYNKTTIPLSNKNEHIEDIVFSHTNVMYIKLWKTGGKTSVYTVNEMNQLEKIKLSSSSIGKIIMLLYDSNLIYEDKANNKIRNYSEDNNTELFKGKNYTLLGSDRNEKVYVCEKNSSKITKILCGDIKTSVDKWQTINLPTATDYNNVIITLDGRIYINKPLEGSILDVRTNKVTSYKGNFIKLCTCGVVSNLNEKYNITPIK